MSQYTFNPDNPEEVKTVLRILNALCPQENDNQEINNGNSESENSTYIDKINEFKTENERLKKELKNCKKELESCKKGNEDLQKELENQNHKFINNKNVLLFKVVEDKLEQTYDNDAPFKGIQADDNTIKYSTNENAEILNCQEKNSRLKPFCEILRDAEDANSIKVKEVGLGKLINSRLDIIKKVKIELY